MNLNKRFLCFIITMLTLSVAGCGGSSESSSPSKEIKEEENEDVDRTIIKLNLNNSISSYNLAPLIGKGGDKTTYELVNKDGVGIASKYVSINKSSEVLTIKSPIGDTIETLDFSIKLEDKEGINETTGEYDTLIQHFRVIYNNDNHKTGTYTFLLDKNSASTEINIDLSDYSPFKNGDRQKFLLPFDVTYNEGCEDLKETGVFVTPKIKKLIYICHFYQDLDPSDDIIDNLISIVFVQEKINTASVYYKSLDSEIVSLGLNSSYYISPTNNNKELFETYSVNGEAVLDDVTFLIPGDTRKLTTVLNSFGLLIKNNKVYLYNTISKKILNVDLALSEGSTISYLKKKDTESSFLIIENISDDNNKIWEIEKDLIGKVAIENIGSIAEKDGIKSIVKTKSNYYSISNISENEYTLKKDGINVSDVVFENNNGIIHNDYLDTVYIPVVLDGLEYIYSYNGVVFENNKNIIMANKINHISGRPLPIHSEQMSFKKLNYMNELYFFKNNILTTMVLHEVNNINHQELFFMPNSNDVESILHNLNKYIADGGSKAGLDTQVFKIHKVISLDSNVFILMNKNGQNVMQHQNGSNYHEKVEDAQIVLGEYKNIIGVKGEKVLHLCEKEGNIIEADHQLNNMEENYKDLSLINYKLVYISNESIEEVDISDSNCK